ncbi:phage tail protein [Clostridium perfringens]|uniref:phage tail protein n=1 Tax=Clostridium perfringens TaxID=1502 RepID=UPI0024BC93EC|nr:phage tail spike protein [Clostridium perfringens]
MLKLKDKNKKLIAGLINYKDLCIESVLATGDKTLSFSLPKEDKFCELIEEEGYIETKTQEYVIKAKDVGVDYTRFDCVLNLEELEANIFDRFESVEQTITASLNLAIVGTGWTIKDNSLKKKRTVRCTNKNALEIIQEIKKTYRVDIVFNTLEKRIEIHEHLGENKGAYFIDSLNITALQVQSDSYKFATRIIAEGKDGLTFADINGGKNYVENFQYSKKIKTIYWKDERYTIKENLLEDAKAKLKEISKPFVSYNASVLNLAELNPKYKNILDYRLGDTITLISKNNKVKDKQRIVKTVEYPQDHSRDTVELANALLKFEDIQQENQETTDTVNNITTDNGTVDGSTIDSITTKQIEDFEANVIKVAKLKAILAEIENLHVNKADIQNLNAVIARIGTLEATKASITELNAIHAIIQQIKAGKADIADLNAAVAKVGILENKTAVLENALAGNLTADNFKTNAITAGSAVIAEGAIGSSQISSLSVNKLEAGDITTSKHRIVSADGTIEIVGNQILINRNNVNRVILGEYRRADGTTEYGLLVRAKDGQTIMLDGNGVHNAGITDGAIDNNKVADNANISGNKLDINSVIREVNTHGTETIKGTKVQIGDRTLDVELSTQKNTITEHGKELSSQKATIQALDSAIKLKVDTQTFTQSTTVINNNINKAKEDAINTANNNISSAIDNLKIGGRNLAQLTESKEYSSFTGRVNDCQMGYEILLDTLNVGDPVTVSYTFSYENLVPVNNHNDYGIWLQGCGDVTEWNSGGFPGGNRLTPKINWGVGHSDSFKVEYTFKLEANAKKNKKWFTSFRMDYIQSGKVSVKEFMVEYGTKANAYIQAPEDLKVYADKVAKAKADLAQANAIANADGKITEEEKKRIQQAQENLNTAIARADKAKADAKAYSDTLGQQLKANAEKYANDVAVAKSELVKQESKAYADGIVTAEEKKRIDEARKNLDTAIAKATEAETKAKSYADSKKQEAIKAAENLALEKSNLAKKYADDVATAKANLAKTEAIANADGKISAEEKKRIQQAQENLNTAISKADKAKQDAINEANRVAELKKQEAISSANSHADNKANEALNNAKAFVNAEITTVNSHLNKATSEINVLKKQIELKVGQSDIDKSIQKVNFGGRNLIKNSYINDETSAYGAFPRELTVNLEEGETYCFSIKGHIDQVAADNKKTLTCFIYEDTWKYGCVSIDISSVGVNQTKHALFKPKKTGVYKFMTYLFPNGGDRNGKVFIEWAKLEKGNKPTDWTPAPEDTNQLIVDNIKTVTDKITTVESTLVQKTNSIEAGVRDLNSTTQTITTNVSNINRDLTNKINSNLDVAKNFATDVATNKANIAKQEAILGARNIPDTRNDNQSPGWYIEHYPKQLINEFKNANVIGITGTTYGILETKVPWGDSSGGFPVQTFRSNNTPTYQRRGLNSTNWSAWEQIEDTQGSQAKANDALNNAKAYTNAEITTVNSKVHNVESNLNILSDRINSKVSQSDIDKSIQEIKIGGRNLIVNSDILQNLFSPLSGYSGTREVIEDNYALCKKDVVFKCTHSGTGFHLPLFTKNSNRIGKTYTWSFWAKCSVNKRGTIGHESNGQTQVEFTTEWKKFSHTWLFGDCTYSSFTFYIGWNVGEVLYIRDFKIEEGTKATDWTPAPEDINSLIVDNIKVVDTKISDVSSSVTQLRDSVTTQINSINSKTHTIETTLGGKASKQEVTEVNNRVATIKASLDGITQRVSATESKTQTLETNLNGKASKQEVNNVSSKVVSLEANLSGITNRVSNTESRINSVDGKVNNATTRQEFTEFKQGYDNFKLDVSKNFGSKNLIRNSGFLYGYNYFYPMIYEFDGHLDLAVWTDSSEWVVSDTCALTIRGGNFNRGCCGARQDGIKLKPNTKYTIAFSAAAHRCKWRLSLNTNGWGQLVWAEGNSTGGKDPNNWDNRSITFVTGPSASEITNCKLDLVMQNRNANDPYAWFTNIILVEGEFAPKWAPMNGESYSNTVIIDQDKVKTMFENSTYAQMGRDGFGWYAPGMKYPYRCLGYHEAVSINTDGSNNYIYRDIQLPARFDYVDPQYIEITASLKGWYKYTGKVFNLENITISTGKVYRANGHTYAQIACRGCIRHADTFGVEGLQVVATLHVTA